MKKTSWLISLIFIAIQSFAQQNIIINPNSSNSFKITESSLNNLSISASFNELAISQIKTPDGNFCALNIDEAINRGEIGSPALPQICKTIRIPEKAKIKINIIEEEYTEIALSNYSESKYILPYQGPISKSNNDFKFNKNIYKTKSYLSQELIKCEIIGNFRNQRLATLKINPISYNPDENTIKICTKVTFNINFAESDISKTNYQNNIYENYYFSQLKNEIINNSAFETTKDALKQYPIKYVIVSDTIFAETLEDFVTWKTKKGFLVETVYTNNSAVGNTAASIKSYLQNMYDSANISNPAQSFILIVGDVEQVPAFLGSTGTHYTDMYYAEYTGDFIADAYVGRFSATNTEQLQSQINKTLEYEQYLFANESWLDSVVLVSGDDASWAPLYANGQINYLSSNYFNEDYNLNAAIHLYPESSDEDLQIRTEIGKGVSFATYTAHGNSNGWTNPNFIVSHVSEMNNKGKYPLMVGNACKTNTFNTEECFGEALLRANEKGAIGYIGASNSTYWSEDFYWAVGTRENITLNAEYDPNNLGVYDKLFHNNNEDFSNWFVSQGEMILAGNLSVMSSGSSDYDYYCEIYNLMGDPSLMPYIGIPSNLEVSFPQIIPIGQSSIQIISEPYTYIGISQNGIWHGAGLTDANGNLTLDFIPFETGSNIDIVATKQFRKPFSATISAINPSSAYVLYNNYTLNDQETGNNNQLADFGESSKINIQLKNFGQQDASNISSTLRTSSNFVTITDSLASYPLIAANEAITINDAFAITIDSITPDQSIALFDLIISDGTNTWTSQFPLTIQSPKLKIKNIAIIDTITGNYNSSIEIGETINAIIPIENNGHSDLNSATSTLSTTNSYAQILSSENALNNLTVGSNQESIHKIKISDSAPLGEIIDLKLTVQSGNITTERTFSIIIGRISENWENNNFTQLLWINESSTPWTIDTNAYQGNYCAKSGKITDSQSSTLQITGEVLINDSISFYKKTSCESPYNGSYFDYMGFSIDDTMLEKFGGVSNWSKESYFVEAGTRTFKWTYVKDFSMSENLDAVFIDEIVFPPMQVIDGIEHLNLSEKFSVYPNPANDKLSLNFNHCGGEFSIQIIDCLGRCIIKQSAKSAAGQIIFPIDISEMKNGYYFVKIINSENSFSKAFVKEN